MPPRIENLEDGLRNRLGVLLDLRLPEAQHRPAGGLEGLGVLGVALYVSLDLRYPVPGIGTPLELDPTPLPVFAVPEIAVAKDDEPSFGKDDVGLAGELNDVYPVPAAGPPKGPAKQQLATRVGFPARSPG